MRRVQPHLSASLILVDRSEPVPRFLFGKRHARHVFMPERFVFPGGHTDLCDLQLDCPDKLHTQDAALIQGNLGAKFRHYHGNALALSAIREAWEETGLLIGTAGPSAAVPPAWQPFADRDHVPAPSKLRLLARAITPPQFPRRYDTWFFMAFRDAITHNIDVSGPDSELDQLVWATHAQTADIDLPFITRQILQEAVVRLDSDPSLHNEATVPVFLSRAGKMRRDVMKV